MNGEESVEWAVVGSPLGPLMVVTSPRGLVTVAFHASAPVRDSALASLAHRFRVPPTAAPSDIGTGPLARPIRQLAAYFAGELREFTLPLDWSLSSGFHLTALKELAASVRYGEVVGYGELAARTGSPGGAQAVGAAMASNPLPIVVPCHRVVESDGGLGGFSGGVETKRRLLALEGVLPEPLF